jgi:hypothetical protein
MTEAVAQMPYPIASNPQAMIIHKAVIDLNPDLVSVPGQRLLPRSLPRPVVRPAGGKWRGYSQKRCGRAMVGRRPVPPRPPQPGCRGEACPGRRPRGEARPGSCARERIRISTESVLGWRRQLACTQHSAGSPPALLRPQRRFVGARIALAPSASAANLAEIYRLRLSSAPRGGRALIGNAEVSSSLGQITLAMGRSRD